MQRPQSGPPPTLPGFERYPRFWIQKRQRFAAKIAPGECYVTRNDELIVTTLGSCISACIRDPVVGIGGMNHFILPEAGSSADKLAGSSRYGTFAMEELINSILKYGGRRERLEAKVTGGGNMLGGVFDVGAANARFVLEYLATEGIQVVARDLGGSSPRKVLYVPREGRMFVKKMARFDREMLVKAESQYQQQLDRRLDTSDVELF